MKKVPLAILKTMINYNPVDGSFIWRKRPLTHFFDKRAMKIWNTRYSGKTAGTKRKGGYIFININDGNLYGAHRLAWLFSYGKYPRKYIDHIDGNPGNNKIDNLRECTSSQNGYNSKTPLHNTSGYKGVSYRHDRRKWRAGIKVNGRQIALGHFKSLNSAHLAYCQAAKKYHGEFARPNG